MQNPKAKLSTINGIIRDEKIFRVRFIYAKKVKGEMCKRCDVCMKAIEMNCEWNTMLCIVEQILEEQLSTGILERFAAEKDNEKKKKGTLPSTPRRDTKRPRNNQTEECVRWFSQARWMYSLIERLTY